ERVEQYVASVSRGRTLAADGVDAPVDVRPDPLVELLDLVSEVGRVRVDHGGGEGAELRGEVDADRAELVADDAPGDAVPQRRYRHVPVESGFRRLVRIPQEGEPVDGVRAVGGTECPPTRVTGTVDVGHGDHVLEAGERMGDRHPLCPGAEPAG